MATTFAEYLKSPRARLHGRILGAIAIIEVLVVMYRSQ